MREINYQNKIIMMGIDEVKPNDYNPNFMPQRVFESMKEDIKKTGKFYGAIIINKEKIIVDGEHRWKALKELGAKTIPCILDTDLDEKQSKIRTLRMGRQHGDLTPVETGMLLLDLQKTIPPDILSQVTSIPIIEMQVLTNLKYEPTLQTDDKDDERISWNRIDVLIADLSKQLGEKGRSFQSIFTISRGGLVPARLLADKMNIKKITVDAKSIPKDSLFVDDIFDTGKTYNETMKICKDPKTVTYATLYARKGKTIPKNLVYAIETAGSEYVVFPWDKLEYRRSLKSNTKKK